MSLPFDTFTLGFGGGLENKSDPKRLDPGKLLRAENVEFVKGNSLRTRAGATAVDTIPVSGPTLSGVSLANPTGPNGNPRGLAAFADGFCLLTDQALYSHSPVDNKLYYNGHYNPITHTATALANSNESHERGETASVGGIVVHVAQISDGVTSSVRIIVLDEESGVLLGEASATGLRPKVFRVGGVLIATYIDSSNDLTSWRIVPGDVADSLSSTNTLFTDFTTTSPYAIAEATDDFALIIWESDNSVVTGMRVAQILSDGSAGINTTFTGSTAEPSGVAISYDATTGDGIIAWTTIAGNLVRYATFTASSLSMNATVTAVTEVASVHTIAVSFIRYYISGILTRKILLVYTMLDVVELDNSISKFYHDSTLVKEVRHSIVASGSYSDGTNGYVLLFHDSRSGLQDTFYLFNAFGVVIGHVNPELSDKDIDLNSVPEFRKETGQRFQISLIAKRQVDAIDDGVVVWEHPYSNRVVFDPEALPRSDRFGLSTYLSGSYLWCFDGDKPQEAGLLMFPDMLNADITEPASSGFANTNEVYSYKVYYCRRLFTGEVLRSKALTIVHTTVDADTKLQLEIPTLSFSIAPEEVYIEVYRSLADAAAPALHFLVSSPTVAFIGADNGFLQNDPTVDSLVFTDALADIAIESRAVDYQSQGEVPQSIPPGPSYVKQVGNRLYCLGGGIPDNQVWFSKPYVPSRPAALSTVLVVDDVPDAGGDVTALSDLGGIPVVFKERSIFALAGTPPDALNANGFLETQRLLGEVGCAAPGTVVSTLYGIKFRSHKGFYLLGLDRSLQYTGRDVEGFNGVEFVSGALIPETNTMLFVGPEAAALVFDYEHGQWGNWTNRSGYAVLSYGNNQVAFLATDGEILLRDQTIYHDNGLAYETIIRTAPIKPFDSATKFWHLAMYQFLGAYLGMHSLRCKLYYNREPAPFQTFTFDPTTVINLEGWGSGNWGDGTWGGTPNPENPVEYQFEKRPRRVRCQTISFEFECLPVDGDPAAMEFSEMTFKAAPIPGMSQLSAARKL